jgi:hydroxymethylpyrimidine/phosphomethylpyrimidine kinase
MRTVLTIAGSDSGGGAGIQADLKTIAAHGLFGTSALTAVTAQNTVGVNAVHVLPSDFVTAQIEAVASDIGVHAAKTGMLATAAIVEAVAAAVNALDIPLLVVDPVMISKSGSRLLDDEAIGALRAVLLRRAFVVTPNIPEAEALSGIAIRTDADRREAARAIHGLGAGRVIVKGGHFASPHILDLLFDGHTFEEFPGERVEGRHTHGTGCTYSAALACHLALGRSLSEAIPLTQHYVAGAIRAGIDVGHGHGPMDHFWRAHADRGGRL